MTVVIGLTGGIGAGKSTVAGLLADRGATVIDVDALGRRVLEPTGGAYAGVVAAFGDGILAGDGTIDRVRLAEVVFGVDGRLGELEAISHPAINDALRQELAEAESAVVVLDMAVLTESQLGRTEAGPLFQRVVVVEAPLAARLARLAKRGLTEEAARDRMAAQASDAERRAIADLIVPNGGSPADLKDTIDVLWPTVEAWASQGPLS